MMIDPILSTILNAVADAASAMFPNIAEQVRTWNAAIDLAGQRKNKRLTKEAIDVRQRLRNPFFETTHLARAIGIARKNLVKAETMAAIALGDAVEKVILAKQARILFEDIEEATAPIDASRKQNFSYEHQDVESFVEEMAERNVPPSSLARAPKPVNDLVAKIYRYSVDDPQVLDPENPLYLLARQGDTDALARSVTDDEERVLSEVADLHNDPEWFALREKLEERIGRKLDLTPAFAASMERLAKARDRLTDNEASILFRADQKVYEAQGRQLAHIFGMAETDVPKLAVLVSCVKNGVGWTDEHYTVALAFKTLEQIVQDIQRCGVEPGFWLSEFKRDIEEFESRIPEGLPVAEQFHALLSHVIARSEGLQTYYEERTERATFDTLTAPAPVDGPSTLELFGVELPPEPVDANAAEQDAGKGGVGDWFAEYEILPPEHEDVTRPFSGAHVSRLTPMPTPMPSKSAPHHTMTFRPEDFE